MVTLFDSECRRVILTLYVLSVLISLSVLFPTPARSQESDRPNHSSAISVPASFKVAGNATRSDYPELAD